MIIILFKILILFRICLDLKIKHLTLLNGMVDFCSKHLAIPSKFQIGFNIIALVLIKYNVMCMPWNSQGEGHTAWGWKGVENHVMQQ